MATITLLKCSAATTATGGRSATLASTTAQVAPSCVDSAQCDAAALQLARSQVAKFTQRQDGRAAWTVALTLGLWVAMLYLGAWWFRFAPLNTFWGLALSALWVLVRTGTYTRAFVLTHDTTHDALFNTRWKNWWTGIFTGLCIAMDAPDMRRTHLGHHAISSIEEEAHRDPNGWVFWTTSEWAAWPSGLLKAATRVVLDPLVMFTAVAPFYFLAFNASWPHTVTHQSPKGRTLYIMGKMVFVPSLFAAVAWFITMPQAQVWAEIMAQAATASYAMFLLCIQHTFEGVYTAPKVEFDRTAAGLWGTSFLSMPWWWQWASCGIEHHHFHHLFPSMPCYRMKECELSMSPEFWQAAGVRKISGREAFRSMLLSLWDPEQRCYVPFPEWAWLYRLLAPAPQKIE